MTEANYRVAFVHNHLFHYRSPIYRLIAEQNQLSIRLFLGGIDTKALSDLNSAGIDYVLDEHQQCSLIGLGFGALMPSLPTVRRIVEWRPHVIVTDGLSSFGTNALLFMHPGLRNVAGYVWWSLGAIPYRNVTLKSRLGDWLQKWFTKRSCAVLAYSSHAADFFRNLGVPKKRVFIGYNTLDERSILESVEKCKQFIPALSEQLDLGSSPVAIFSGTINEGKRLDLALKALAIILGEHKELHPVLIVMGDGPALNKMQELAANLGITDAVRFVGRQHEMASAYYLLADFAVLPGLGGLAINHAFAHGLPIVCGPADGCELDLVHTGKTGIYLPQVMEHSLANAMTRLFTDRSECRRMGKAAKTLVTTEITIENYSRTLMDAINLCIAEGKYERRR